MRLYDLVLYTLVFNIAIIMANAMIADPGMPFGSLNGHGYSSFMNNSSVNLGDNSNSVKAYGEGIKNTAYDKGTNLSSNGGDNILDQTFGFFNAVWRGFFYVLATVLNLFVGTVGAIYTFLDMVGLPWYISGTIQGLVWVIYAIGIIQFLAGRSFREQI